MATTAPKGILSQWPNFGGVLWLVCSLFTHILRNHLYTRIRKPSLNTKLSSATYTGGTWKLSKGMNAHFLNENEKQIHQGHGDVGMADFVPFIRLENVNITDIGGVAHDHYHFRAVCINTLPPRCYCNLWKFSSRLLSERNSSTDGTVTCENSEPDYLESDQEIRL